MRNIGDDEVRVLVGSGENSIFVNVKKGEKVMVGSGEGSIFVEAGLTPEESLRRIDERIDQIVENYEKNLKKEKQKKKVLTLFKKNN